jgi:phenylalanyl-tRNA synthetase beta subunit
VNPHVSTQDIKDTIVARGSELLRLAELFGVYASDPIPAGKKKLTYTLVYQATDRTLKDKEGFYLLLPMANLKIARCMYLSKGYGKK